MSSIVKISLSQSSNYFSHITNTLDCFNFTVESKISHTCTKFIVFLDRIIYEPLLLWLKLHTNFTEYLEKLYKRHFDE